MKINKSNLQAALEIVKPGLANREVIEQTTAFAFMNGRVVTYNDAISLSHPVEGLTITGAIHAEELYQLLRKTKQDDIEVNVTDNEITLTAGRARAGLTLQSEIKLPLGEITEGGEWSPLATEEFITALRFAVAATSRDTGQPILTCVHINQAGYVEGSDSYRIVHYALTEALPVNTFLIPAASVREVIKLQPTEVAQSTGWVHWRTPEDTILSCRVYEEPFPDCAPFLNISGTPITLPRTIDDIIDRAEVFATGSAAEQDVKVSLANNRIILSSQNEHGKFEEEANVRYSGEPIAFSITPYLLKDILKETQACEYNGASLKFSGEHWRYVTVVKE